MPTILGETVTQDTIDRVVAWANDGRDAEAQLTASEVEANLRGELVAKVKKHEKAKAIREADHESDFALV
jgi:hypothetical protein|tara:strand:- start:1023 stop:1232 length:210 start_codon:yes stop_codon:yes gene_type:complete